MFVLGHVGIGRAIIGTRGRALPFVPFAIGAMLPDVIDKPLYYAHISDFVSCTRTFGHTGLFLLLLVVVAIVQIKRSPGHSRRSPGPSGPGNSGRIWMALAVGTATHAVMDGIMDVFFGGVSSTFIAFTWPFLNSEFYSYPFKTPLDQLRQLARIQVFICELIGMALLWWEFRKSPRLRRRR